MRSHSFPFSIRYSVVDFDFLTLFSTIEFIFQGAIAIANVHTLEHFALINYVSIVSILELEVHISIRISKIITIPHGAMILARWKHRRTNNRFEALCNSICVFIEL